MIIATTDWNVKTPHWLGYLFQRCGFGNAEHRLAEMLRGVEVQ